MVSSVYSDTDNWSSVSATHACTTPIEDHLLKASEVERPFIHAPTSRNYFTASSSSTVIFFSLTRGNLETKIGHGISVVFYGVLSSFG